MIRSSVSRVLTAFVSLLHVLSPVLSAAPRQRQGLIRQSWLRSAAEFTDPAVELVARQQLFDYGVEQGIEILTLVVPQLKVPDYSTLLDIPLIGSVGIHISNISFKQLDVPLDNAQLAIEDRFYHVKVSSVLCVADFRWDWAKGPISGSGTGELRLQGGSLNAVFSVSTPTDSTPRLTVISSQTTFESIELYIHSFSVDWLYQALLFVFQGVIQTEVEGSISTALRSDVPDAVNDVLAKLPARITVEGLPFQFMFTYAVYTMNYVLVKGQGEVDTHDDRALVPCPYVPTPAPFTDTQVKADKHMVTLYADESLLNCVLWGLYQEGILKASLRDGDVPKVRLLTDLFGLLMPKLPRQYPHKGLQLDVEALEAPAVEFNASTAVTFSIKYLTTIIVLNATGDATDLPVAVLEGSVKVVGNISWDVTAFKQITVQYTIRDNATDVSVKMWETIMHLVLSSVSSQLTMQKLIEQYVKTPVSSDLGLVNAEARVYDNWYALSADVILKKLPVLSRVEGTERIPIS